MTGRGELGAESEVEDDAEWVLLVELMSSSDDEMLPSITANACSTSRM